MSDTGNRAPFIVLLAGLGVVVLFLIAGVAGAVIVLQPNNLARLAPRSPTPPPTLTLSGVEKENTAVAQQRPTRTAQARQSATAQAQAEATHAAALATEEAHALATAQAQATQQARVTAQANWLIAFSDAFDNNVYSWPLAPQRDSSIAVVPEIKNGALRLTVTVDNGNSYENFVPEKGPVFTDVYAAVDVRFLGPEVGGQSAYGLIVRQVKQDYIFFGLKDDGAFRVLVVFDTGIYQLYDISSSAIQPAETNRLAVRVIGHAFLFFINNELVWQFTEDDSVAGQVGLGVDALTAHDQTQVEFDNLEVRAP